MPRLFSELLLVLVNFLEILIRVDLKLAASSLVASDDAVLVELESRDSPSVVYAALNAVTESASLVVSADEEENLLCVANGADANGKCGLGNLIGVVIEETGVNDEGVLGESANAGTGIKGGEGLVEGDVTVNAATAHEEIDSAVRRDLFLVTSALCLEILSHTVKNVDILCGNVYMIEEVVVHEVPVALVVILGKTNVFVHIEGNYVLEGNLTLLIHLDELLVNSERRRAGGKAEDEGTVLFVVVDSVGDVLSSPCAHCVIIVFDN